MTTTNRQQRRLDAARLFDDFGIEYQETSSGWLQLRCPVCGDQGRHLGWSGTVFSCFRCGKHGRVEILSLLLGKTPAETVQVLSRYGGRNIHPPGRLNTVKRDLDGVLAVQMPYGTSKMADRHRNYLKKRHFDPERLEQEYGLLGTGPVGPFAHRIIIPIIQAGKLVCYQGRDITGRSADKYKSCPDSEAVVPIKNCLYWIDKALGDSVVITEGPTKVWRLGPGSTATFGAVTTSEQVKRLSGFRRTFILFDADEAGEEGADKLSRLLAVLGSHPTIVSAGVADVGELTGKDARGLMDDLLK